MAQNNLNPAADTVRARFAIVTPMFLGGARQEAESIVDFGKPEEPSSQTPHQESAYERSQRILSASDRGRQSLPGARRYQPNQRDPGR